MRHSMSPVLWRRNDYYGLGQKTWAAIDKVGRWPHSHRIRGAACRNISHRAWRDGRVRYKDGEYLRDRERCGSESILIDRLE